MESAQPDNIELRTLVPCRALLIADALSSSRILNEQADDVQLKYLRE